MKIALSMWSVHQYWYDNTWDTTDFIDFAATTGADGVELLSVFWRDKEAEIPRIQEALQRTGLKVACFSACNNLAVLDRETWEAQVKDITDSVDAAVLFGANIVRVFSGDKEGNVAFEDAKARIISGLKEATEYAQSRGVTLCLENHGLFAGKSNQVLELIQQVNSTVLKSTFDTGNFLLVDENPNDAIDQLNQVVGHVHFKDFQHTTVSNGHLYRALSGKTFVGNIAGEGDVDLQYVLAKLQEAGYDGWLAVEFEGEEEPRHGSIESINNLKRLLN